MLETAKTTLSDVRQKRRLRALITLLLTCIVLSFSVAARAQTLSPSN